MSYRILVLFFFSVTILFQGLGWADRHDADESPYWIIIDGGSTGSRLHIFEFTNEGEVERRGTSRATVPLTDFVDATPQATAEHLLPCFVYAAQQIPPQYHNRTRLYYQATAGMRLLTSEQQERVYDNLYQGLIEAPEFVFDAVQRAHLTTLSGTLEGYYGAVAANYLQGVIDIHLRVQSPGAEIVGALDMGGSSTQIVFRPQPTSSDMCEKNGQTDVPTRLHEADFFSKSYLSFGVDQFRERLWTSWVQAHQAAGKSTTMKIENPCMFPGYSLEWMGHTLVGTGETETCIREVQRLIPLTPEQGTAGVHSDEETDKTQFVVGGIEHPPVRGKFLAMSLWFFSLDSLRALSNTGDALQSSWPRPSLEELTEALPGLCTQPWDEVKYHKHAFTRPQVLPHRCLETVYMVTLLQDGFGFDRQARDITFTFLVNDSEVEWTLGMVLSLRSQEGASAAASVSKGNITTRRRQHDALNAATSLSPDDVRKASQIVS